ncbi:MAG: aldo/keto reductase [Bacteroidota bacterium]|nr:aldo/keto reductase [Bacteroidota bacterium]MDP4216694.1 aldo/keto reductase [Bacteroidota bacterium]MDP4247549.1 aldo/keto reductase [Bacteroidota bacterium]MDP4257239.1 aldo/keto reductase [Bacteroidota bacterium]
MEMELPRVIFGTSGLGNLFVPLDEETKTKIVEACVLESGGQAVFDSAGKYGAGLALEVLGGALRRLNIAPEDVVIMNKLGWLRSPLKGREPTFEPGVWKDLRHDAVQKISYDGIMECYEQGNELLGGYLPKMVSVHDPDEYLAAAGGHQALEDQRYQDILDAYEALFDLKRQGLVSAVGLGAKDWRVIKRILRDVSLDWVMFANSMTVKSHPWELAYLIRELADRGVTVINSAVFHSGFLVGSDYFDYRLISRGDPAADPLFRWREEFFAVCHAFHVSPAAACVQFALNVPGVKSIALQSSDPRRVKENLELASGRLADEFWQALKERKLMGFDPLAMAKWQDIKVAGRPVAGSHPQRS